MIDKSGTKAKLGFRPWCLLSKAYELLLKKEKCEITGYLIGIDPEKQVIIGHLYWLNKIYIVHP